MKHLSRSTFVMVFVCLILIMGCTTESKTLKLTPSKLDFGTVNIGDTFSIDVVLKNKYGKPMIISNITITGSSDYSITAGGTLPINLDNNAEHTLTIMFTPSVDGAAVALMSFVHDASTKAKEVDLEGIGVAVARIVLSENSHDFGKKLINRSHTHDFDVENVGTADLVISGLSFAGTGAALYSSTAAPLTITPGNTTTITVTFEPIVVGNYVADLAITHNAVNENSPMLYAVEGEAIDVDPQITLSQPSPWDFGSVATTMPSTQICEIENTGIDPLTVTSATLATGTAFTIDSLKDSNGNVINFPQTIAVAAKIMLAIKFAPTTNTVYNDTLTFVHDGTNEATPWDIPLTGEGRAEISRTFTYTGAAQQWTVPAGVSAVQVDCYGAEGGKSYPDNTTALAGKGGRVQAFVSVTPGSTLNIYVGQKGGDAASNVDGIPGWNGGGRGSIDHGSYSGGGGGGASDIRSGGTTLTDRIIVGGAGGGAGYNGVGQGGGNGGGLIGQDASAVGGIDGEGHGGSQTAGGAGGDVSAYYPGYGVGQPGTLGNGGHAADRGIGGGGGGGYYGGGGGCWAGGGGGSSFTEVGATGVVHTQGVRNSNGEVKVSY